MKWKYHIPHEWDTPRTVGEDVWLLPDDPDYKGNSIWLTIDALGDSSDPSHGSEREEFQKEALEKLGNKEFWIDNADMIIRVRDFNKEELLVWVKVWLTENGFTVSDLIEAPFKEFAETNDHAKLIEQLKHNAAKHK